MGSRNYYHENIHDQRSIFLPTFCRLSIKDVKVSTIPITADAAEPSSPKVSCMGQVKRNNRVRGFPTATAAAAAAKHTKPKKVHFSTKTLLPNPTTMATAAAAGGGGRRKNRDIMCSNSVRRSRLHIRCDRDQDCCLKVEVEVEVDITDMDPPLPVVKRVAPPGGCRDEINIWKRRFNGEKSLEIEPIHLPISKFQQPATSSS